MRIDLSQHGVAACAWSDARDQGTDRRAIPHRDIRDRSGRIPNRQHVQRELIRRSPVAREQREIGCVDDLPTQHCARQPGRPLNAARCCARRAGHSIKPNARIKGEAPVCQMLVSMHRQRREVSKVGPVAPAQRPHACRHPVDQLGNLLDACWRDAYASAFEIDTEGGERPGRRGSHARAEHPASRGAGTLIDQIRHRIAREAVHDTRGRRGYSSPALGVAAEHSPRQPHNASPFPGGLHVYRCVRECARCRPLSPA